MRSLPDSTELAIQVTSEDPKKKDQKDKDKEDGLSIRNELETLAEQDILSVLAMTYSDTQPRGTLRYRLLSASLRPAGSPLADPGTWGHEYVRHLAAELGDEYTLREQEVDAPTPTPAPEAGKEEAPTKVEVTGTVEDLRALAKECAVFLIGHNAEPDAVDLLEELEIVDEVAQLVDDNTYNRVCQYMIRCHHKFPEALALVIRLGDPDLIREDFNGAGNPLMKRQLAFLLARAQTPIEWLRTPSENPDKEIDIEDEFPKDLRECLSNTRMSGHFRDFGKELGVTDPKSLEDVYKTHLENTRPTTLANVDSARGNLAGTFVNTFVNAGFGNDKLMVYKNKEHGMMSATASLGLSLLWDTDLGLSHVDLLVRGADVAKGLISKYVDNKSVPLKTSAIMGLALAYAGSHREDLLQLLIPHISDDATMEIVSLATLALGFIFVGSENGEITSMILQTLMEKAERGDIGLDEKWARFMALGLGLLYLGLQDASDTTIETLKAIEHPISKTAQIVVEVCTFAGTGNVLKVQAMLRHCDEHINMKEKEADKDKKKEEKKDEPVEGAAKEEAKPEGKPDDTFQAFAVIAVALIAMGEDVGAEMSLRQFHHLMHYGEPVIRKSLPLAIGLVSISNPQLPILDTLSKYSHDNDLAVAFNAILAMGLVGAGTNNARLAQMLRQLAGYYYKEPDCLFMVRVAQGLVHMGKGTIGLNPFFADQSIMSRPAMVGLLATLTAFTDAKHFILDKYHWMMYFLFEKPIEVNSVFEQDECADVIAVTKGHGFASPTNGQPRSCR
ncbi:armadillo-type protein, partial [Mycena leptocephala]